MSELSERDLEDAAREAGISPDELRSELARRSGGPANPYAGSNALAQRDAELPPVARGSSADHVSSPLPLPPESAVRAVKHHIEQQLGTRGQMHGSREADVYDEQSGMVYRVHAEDDGEGGSLVRIDLDPTPLRAKRVLVGMGLGASAGLFLLTGFVLPGLLGFALIGSALGIGVLGGVTLATASARATKHARYVASTALVEAESGVATRVLAAGRE
jgi:hypothetical protein